MMLINDNSRTRKLEICERVHDNARQERPIEAAMDLSYFEPMSAEQLLDSEIDRIGEINSLRRLISAVNDVIKAA